MMIAKIENRMNFLIKFLNKIVAPYVFKKTKTESVSQSLFK